MQLIIRFSPKIIGRAVLFSRPVGEVCFLLLTESLTYTPVGLGSCFFIISVSIKLSVDIAALCLTFVSAKVSKTILCRKQAEPENEEGLRIALPSSA